MTQSNSDFCRFHEDRPLFREAVLFTSRENNFSTMLVEKDYYCSLLLSHLCSVRSKAVKPLGRLVNSIPETFRECGSRNRSKAITIRNNILPLSNTLLKFDVFEKQFLKLVGKKLMIPDNDPADVSLQKKELLKSQMEVELQSVLRQKGYDQFDLEESFKIVSTIANKLGY